MIYITLLIYIVEDQEDIFQQFEKMAIPIISKYNGRLNLRIRPRKDTIIECNIEKPYEIHLIEFSSEQDFENFKNDTERKRFLHLREKSIKTTILIKGEKI